MAGAIFTLKKTSDGQERMSIYSTTLPAFHIHITQQTDVHCYMATRYNNCYFFQPIRFEHTLQVRAPNNLTFGINREMHFAGGRDELYAICIYVDGVHMLITL